MDILKNSICYLIGAIDDVDDCGKTWRLDIIQKCHDNNLHIKFLDPTHKVTGLQKEVDEEYQKIVDYKTKKQYNQLSSFMRRIVREDHRGIDLSDFVIMYIDPNAKLCGSYFELQSALTEKKPYFIICPPDGRQSLPPWLFGILDHRFVFSCIESVVFELQRINSGKTSLSDRWVLFRDEIENL